MNSRNQKIGNIRDQLKMKLFTEKKPINETVEEQQISTETIKEEKQVQKENEPAEQKKVDVKAKQQQVQRNKDFLMNYDMKDSITLGQGAHATVKTCVSLKDNKKYAVKITKTKDPERMIQEMNTFNNQKSLNHEYICKAHELYLDQKKAKVYFVMEYCQYPSLRSILNRYKVIKEEEVKKIIFSLVEALKYMHNIGICHRDLKPENILINPQDFSKIKIVDFGISAKFKFRDVRARKIRIKEMLSKQGTTNYMAPEMFTLASYNETVDCWALGVITYELLCGSVPFQSQYALETQELILSGKFEFNQKIPQNWLSLSQGSLSNELETITENQYQEDLDKTPLSSLPRDGAQNNGDQGLNIVFINIWDKISKLAKNFIQKTVDVKSRIKIDLCYCHPWIYDQQNNSKKSIRKNLDKQSDSNSNKMSVSQQIIADKFRNLENSTRNFDNEVRTVDNEKTENITIGLSQRLVDFPNQENGLGKMGLSQINPKNKIFFTKEEDKKQPNTFLFNSKNSDTCQSLDALEELKNSSESNK